MNLRDLSDETLLSGLTAMTVSERGLVARIVAYLAEVEERQLALRAAFPSLFEFCVRRLGFSEGEAFRRMTAARLVRRFPIVLALLEDGAIHMSGLVLLRSYLTNENHEELLREAARKSKREILEMLARRFPRADVPTTVTPLLSEALPLGNAAPPGTEGSSGPPSGAAPKQPPTPGARVEPIAPARYRLETTIPDVLRAKLERAIALLRHRNPSGDLVVVLDHAVDALLERLERERLGKRRSTRIAARDDALFVAPGTNAELANAFVRAAAGMNAVAVAAADPESPVTRRTDVNWADAKTVPVGVPTLTATAAVTAENAGTSTAEPRVAVDPVALASAPANRHVPRAVRRAVFVRDGERCTFVSADGMRCTACEFLELDHVIPVAHGGPSTVDNLRILCRAHNRLSADHVFGRERVDASIHFRQRKSQLDLVARGLKYLGFKEPEIRRATTTLETRFATDLPAPDALVLEAIALLT